MIDRDDYIETLAKQQYEDHIKHLEGHHCPPWDALSDLMKEHLIYLASKVFDQGISG